MTRFLNFLGVALMVIAAVFVTPTPQVLTDAGPLLEEQLYSIRVKAPDEPYHNRSLVLIPTTFGAHYLGLENLTTAPTTPPLTFSLIPKLDRYRLKSSLPSTNPKKVPHLIALPHLLFPLMIMTIIELPGNYPRGTYCTVDEFMVNLVDENGVHGNFRYHGFTGMWKVEKDAPVGWNVTWYAEAWVEKPTQFDLVPVTG